MKELFVKARNATIGFIYRYILKPVFFLLDPEEVHDRALNIGTFLGRFGITRGLTKWLFNYQNSALEQNILGINAIGKLAITWVESKKKYVYDEIFDSVDKQQTFCFQEYQQNDYCEPIFRTENCQ